MKKILAFLPCVIVSASNAAPAQGFNVFAAAGPAWSQMKAVGVVNDPVDQTAGGAQVIPLSQKNTSFGFGSAQAGVGYTFALANNMFVGVALSAIYSSLTPTKVFDVGVGEGVDIRNVQLTQGQNLGGVFALKVGYSWEKWELSLGCGAVFTPFWLQALELPGDTGNPVSMNVLSTKKTLWGVQPTVTVAYKLSQDVQLFMEASQTYYQQKVPLPVLTGTSSAGTPEAYAIAGGGSTPRTSALMVGVQVTL